MGPKRLKYILLLNPQGSILKFRDAAEKKKHDLGQDDFYRYFYLQVRHYFNVHIKAIWEKCCMGFLPTVFPHISKVRFTEKGEAKQASTEFIKRRWEL